MTGENALPAGGKVEDVELLGAVLVTGFVGQIPGLVMKKKNRYLVQQLFARAHH